ncbi:MAG: SdrD B-like domain-containing protein, partial [Candidatus Altarchaeaceae archaeon]
ATVSENICKNVTNYVKVSYQDPKDVLVNQEPKEENMRNFSITNSTTIQLRAITANISVSINNISLFTGETKTIYINITNTGEDVYNVYIKDILPQGIQNLTPAEIVYSTIAKGETKTFAINVTATTCFDSNLGNNKVYIEWSDSCLCERLNISTESEILPVTRLIVNKISNTSVVKTGENVLFTINVTNPSLCNVTYNLTDVLPLELLTNDTISFTNEIINPGETKIYLINATANSEETINITNVAKLTYITLSYNNDTGAVEEIKVEEISNVTITIIGECKLKITKNVTPEILYCGNYARFDIEISNLCNYTAYDINVYDILPQELDVAQNSTISKYIDELQPNESVIWTIYAKIKEDVQKNVTNRVIASYVKFDGGEWKEQNISASATLYLDCTKEIGCGAILNVTVISNTTIANYGDVIKFTINVSNIGTHTSYNTNVKYVLPDGFENLTPIEINVGNLNPGESQTVEILVRVTTNETKIVTNTFNTSWRDEYYGTDNSTISNIDTYVNFNLTYLAGKVFDDINANGVYDIDEKGIPNITVYLLIGGNVLATVTDVNGDYAFMIYIGNNQQILANVSVQQISDRYNTTPMIVEIIINSTENKTINFGFKKYNNTGNVTVITFYDKNLNGIQESYEVRQKN